jgi:hypothetical protein
MIAFLELVLRLLGKAIDFVLYVAFLWVFPDQWPDTKATRAILVVIIAFCAVEIWRAVR